jgi:hypothetical protein
MTKSRDLTKSLAAEIPRPFIRIHGQLRGLDAVGRSPGADGRFGRMFRTLPPAEFTDQALNALADEMVAKEEGQPTPETADPPDDEENVGTKYHDTGLPAIAAGYTYLGQFIDHDLTFDPASSLQKENDPDALLDFRTPRFDLDNIYGRGPDDQPYLYQDDGIRMALGRALTGNSHDPKARDLPRFDPPPPGGAKRALIGDPRNDENVIVSQLQATFLRFHNRVADFLGITNPDDFKVVQREVRWHYQWVVVNDFLPTILNARTLDEVLPHVSKRTDILRDPPQLKYYCPKGEAFMPVEFSVAAYRFGHSMVRPQYRLNEVTPPGEGAPEGGPDPRLPIFAPAGTPSLVGFDAFPSTWAVDWRLFFPMRATSPNKGKDRVQPAYKIDASIVNPLGALPGVVARGMPSLAARNLFRGRSMELPSGQAVARAMGIDVLAEDQLGVGKANEGDFAGNKRLVDLSAEFEDNAPLWFYILAESAHAFQSNTTPLRLGPVGARIVAEVFAGLLLYDRQSFFKQNPAWKPHKKFLNGDGKFGMPELIAQAMQA